MLKMQTPTAMMRLGACSFSASPRIGHKFTGKERDSESSLDNFGARYFTSSMGRFMTPYWAAKPVAVPYANYGNPQSLDLYSYVNNNPTTTRDLDGHSDYLWQKFKNSLEGKGWKTDAKVKGWNVAQTAANHVGSKDWAINGMNTSGKDDIPPLPYDGTKLVKKRLYVREI